jgi:DNA-binding transcriptional regulator LsrR (DeoR family)
MIDILYLAINTKQIRRIPEVIAIADGDGKISRKDAKAQRFGGG